MLCRNDIKRILGRFHNPGDGGDLSVPLFCFALEFAVALLGENVVFSPSVIFCGPPLALNPSRMLQTAKGRKEGAWVHLEYALTDLLKPKADAVPVHRFQIESLQDEHVQSAL